MPVFFHACRCTESLYCKYGYFAVKYASLFVPVHVDGLNSVKATYSFLQHDIVVLSASIHF